MAVEIYRGRYVKAESALNYIDKETIIKGCNKIKEAVGHLKDIAKNVEVSKEYCSKDNLSIEGYSMEEELVDCTEDYLDTANYMEVFSDAISKAVEVALDNKQKQLNIEARRKDMQVIREVESRRRDSVSTTR